MVRAHSALAHIVSQLVYAWLPPPRPGVSTEGVPEPETMNASDWRDLAFHPATHAVLPWLPRYLSTRDPDGQRVAAAAHAHLCAAAAAGARYLVLGDPEYPELLGMLRDPPHGLTVLGDLALLGRPAVAVIGSRKASGLAVQTSFAVGRTLAEAGALVVSGGAFGCDIAAHHGVLAASSSGPAPAACVFACGLARCYPRANEPVFRRLRQRCALLISERLWSSPCRPPDFPSRNRIIAGLAATTVVMQAADRSGAMVTARLALDQGRDVAALRHPDGDVRAAGGASLLADGAAGFGSPGELLKLLNISPMRGDLSLP